MFPTAEKAYRQALHALTGVTAFPPQTTPDIFDPQAHPLLSSLFPNQQGPIASIIRIIFKLRQQSWIPNFLRGKFSKDRWSAGKRKEEMEGKALKVVDLLEYAIDLGHMDALYKLAHASLVSGLRFSSTIKLTFATVPPFASVAQHNSRFRSVYQTCRPYG